MTPSLLTRLPSPTRPSLVTRRSSHAGFSVVEALVATAMLGIAGGLLAATLTVTTATRRRATLELRTARFMHERISDLSRRPCTAPDTSGASRDGPVLEWWTAQRAGGGWAIAESVSVAGLAPGAQARGTVLCP